MEKQLTKKEIRQRKKEIYNGVKESEKLLVDFGFSMTYINTKTGNKSILNIDRTNFALAFHPYIWSKIDLAHKIAVCRVAYKEIHNKDIKEFENYNSNSIVFVGKNYNGSFNLGALYREDVHSIDLLQQICHGENKIRENDYFNNYMKKTVNTVYDFESFEAMQYMSPLEFTIDYNSLDNQAKAIFLDKLTLRNYRQDLQKSLDLMMDGFEPLREVSKEIYDYCKAESDSLMKTNLFIMENLGSNSFERDEQYLEIKVRLFNKRFIEEYNKKSDEYNAKLEAHNKNVRAYNKLIAEYKNPTDAISQMFTEKEIDKFKPTIDEGKAELNKIKAELDAIDKNIVTFEDAKKHFKEHFEDRFKVSRKTFDAKTINEDKFERNSTSNDAKSFMA